jgi:hypothetical protein
MWGESGCKGESDFVFRCRSFSLKLFFAVFF